MKRGFSLIELLVVVAIIAILVGVATPYYQDYVRESKRTKALQDLDVLKQAVVLFNSQEDLPYRGMLATDSALTEPVPILGENDFNGLQGRYLTYIPVDPWGKNYKLDPFACYVFSEGPDSRVDTDNIKDYYIKDLALVRIEWEDFNNDREMTSGDNIHFIFNKPLYCNDISDAHFEVYENNQVVGPATAALKLTAWTKPAGYSYDTATGSIIVAQVTTGNTVKLGVHALAFKDNLAIMKNYMEVRADRIRSTNSKVYTAVDPSVSSPYRYVVRTNPIKITKK